MFNSNFKFTLLFASLLFIVSCGKSTIGSRKAEINEIMNTGINAPAPEYTYSTYKNNPHYVSELGEFWYISRHEKDWKEMNQVGMDMIHHYEKIDSIPFEGKRSIVELISFELLKDFLIIDNLDYSNRKEDHQPFCST